MNMKTKPLKAPDLEWMKFGMACAVCFLVAVCTSSSASGEVIAPGAVPFDMSLSGGRLYWNDNAQPVLHIVDPPSPSGAHTYYGDGDIYQRGILADGAYVYF